METKTSSKTIQGINVMDIEKRRNPSKHYVFVLEITWDDGSQNVIYRRYSQFFTLQTSLIDSFPLEGGVKNPSERILPFLPGKVLFRSNVREVALKRKGALEEYCKKLIKTPQKILSCELVTSFFAPTVDDICSLTNSLKREGSTKLGGKKKADVISDPVLLEQYIALSDFKKCGKGQISLVAGDVVEVIEKSDNGWFFVCLEDEQGWVPCSYLEAASGAPEEAIEKCESEEKYVCIKPYSKTLDDELDLELGAIVGVLQKGSDGWWEVRYRGKKGWVPRAHIKSAAHLSLSSDQLKEDVVRDRGSLREKSGIAAPPRRRTVKKTIVKRTVSNTSESEYFAISDYQMNIGNRKVNMASGETYTVIEKAPNGWTLIKAGSEEGWVPSNLLSRRRKEDVIFEEGDDVYQNVKTLTPVKEIETVNNELNNNLSSNTSQERYVTVGAYVSADDSGISFKENAAVEVLEQNETGWWYIKIGSEEGWAPSTYLKAAPRSIASGRGTSPRILDISVGPPKPNRKSGVPDSYENVDLVEQGADLPVNQDRVRPVPKPRSASKTSSDGSSNPSPIEELRAAFAGKARTSPNGFSQSIDEHAIRKSNSPQPAPRKVSEPGRPKTGASPVHMKGKITPPVPNRPVSPRIQSSTSKSPIPPERPKTSPTRMSPSVPLRPTLNAGEIYVTVSDYTDQDDGMLSFKAGEKVQVLEKDGGGWWLAMIGVKKGWVPSNFLKQM